MILFAIFILLGIIISIIDKKVIPQRGFDINITTNIQIILAFLIVLAHLSQQLKVWYLRPFTSCGGVAVPIFFFISGFGLMYQFKNKENYLDDFLFKRGLKLLLPFLVSTIIYIIIYYINGESIGGKVFCLNNISFTVLPYSWFVKYLLLFYLIFYIVYRILRGGRNVIIFILISGLVTYQIFVDENPLMYKSSLTFVLGLFVCDFDMRIKDVIFKMNKMTYLLMVICLVSVQK